MAAIRISATQFDVRPVESADQYWDRVRALVQKAASQESQIILFPEYFTMPWVLCHCGQDFQKSLDAFDDLKPEFLSRFTELAKQFQMIIVAGSIPVKMRVRRVNRSFTFLPDGRKFEQDKMHMTRFEEETWGVSSGQSVIRFWEWRGAGVGIALSYDIEIPAYAKELTKKDADIILVPSSTADVHGYWRLRHCAQARAVESQNYVIMSSLVGSNPHLPKLATCYGRGGIFTPCDVGFPEEGVLGLGALNEEGVVTQSLDVSLLHKVRVEGTVLNRRDIS